MYHVQWSMDVRDAYLRGSLLALTPLLPSVRRLQRVDSDTRSRPLLPLLGFSRGQVPPFSAVALYASLVLGLAAASAPRCIAQAVAVQPNAIPLAPPDSRQGLLLDWAGLQVVSITFEGVNES